MLGNGSVVYAFPYVFSCKQILLELLYYFTVGNLVELIEWLLSVFAQFVLFGLFYFLRRNLVLLESGDEFSDGNVAVDSFQVFLKIHVVEGNESACDL